MTSKVKRAAVQRSSHLLAFLAGAVLMMPARPAAAMWINLKLDCSAGPNSSSCNLIGFLHLLYVIAVILGIILVIVLAVAFYVWRRSKRASLKDL